MSRPKSTIVEQAGHPFYYGTGQGNLPDLTPRLAPLLAPSAKAISYQLTPRLAPLLAPSAKAISYQLLVRPEMYATSQADRRAAKGQATLIIAQSRHGPTGDVELKFHEKCGRFENR